MLIEVVDQGLGIPPDQMGRLFRKFERVRTEDHDRIAGTGLGLYICRLIVEGHGGRIWAESAPAATGARSSVLLPLDPAHDKGGAGGASSLEPSRPHSTAGRPSRPRSRPAGSRARAAPTVVAHHGLGVLQHVPGQHADHAVAAR